MAAVTEWWTTFLTILITWKVKYRISFDYYPFEEELCKIFATWLKMLIGYISKSKLISEFLFALSPFEMECLPPKLRDEYSEDLIKEFSERSIVFHKDQNNTKEMYVLYRFNVLVVHLRKPESNYLETLRPELNNGEVDVRNNFGIAIKSAIV